MPAPSRIQSHLRYPLTGLFGSPGNVRVLRALAAVRAPQSAPQLASEAGLTPQGARLVLDALVRQRLVTAHGAGRARLYVLNASHPLAASVEALFRDEHGRWEDLLEAIRTALRRHGAAVSAAWLYGSVARGEDAPASDLDIALVVRSQAVAEKIREELAALEDAQHVHLSLTALTPQELAALPEDDRWWRNVVRDGRVLHGPAPAQARRRIAKAAA